MRQTTSKLGGVAIEHVQEPARIPQLVMGRVRKLRRGQRMAQAACLGTKRCCLEITMRRIASLLHHHQSPGHICKNPTTQDPANRVALSFGSSYSSIVRSHAPAALQDNYCVESVTLLKSTTSTHLSNALYIGASFLERTSSIKAMCLASQNDLSFNSSPLRRLPACHAQGCAA